MRQFADTYGPQGAQVVAVEDSGAAEDKLLLFKESLGVTYPLFYDESKAAREAFGVRTNSTVFILSADFVVRDRAEYGASKTFFETSWQQYGPAR